MSMDGQPQDSAGGLAEEVLDAVRKLRSSGGLLLDHVGVAAELAHVEWREERSRLKRFLLTMMIGAVLLALALLHLGVLVLLAVWGTPFVLPVATALTLGYSAAFFGAWRRLQRVGGDTGAGLSEAWSEIHKTVTLLRRHL
jgi:uncharacterized membrane protein YqjE